MKNIIFSSILFLCITLHAVDSSDTAATIVKTVFGPKVQKTAHGQHLENIIEAFLAADANILCQVAYLAQQELQDELMQLTDTITQKQKDGTFIARKLFYEQFIIQQEIEYLKKFYQSCASSLSLVDKLWQSTKNIFGFYNPEAEKLAHALVEFNAYTRDNYLLDYDKLLLFFSGIKKTPLPKIINYWSDGQLQRRLKKRIATLRLRVEPQQWETILMIGLQSLLLGGEGMYKQWLDEQSQQEFLALQAQITQKNDEFDKYLKGLEDKQKNEIVPAILNSFKTAQKTIGDQYTIINKNQQIELNYLFQSINLDLPVQHYLMFPIVPWDQYFQNGVMLTPDNGYPWYNVFQITYGNLGWIFDATSNSFMQTGLALFGSPFWTNQNNAGNDPSQNSIFTEYISKTSTYDIEIEMNLINCAYPFFAGIMFNRARWISADPERVWQYRLVGLYGTQTDPKDPATRSISLGFAQQVIQFDTDKTTGKQTESIFSPLQQISTQKTPLYTLPASEITSLDKEPISYVFRITTAPTQVQLTLLKKDVSGTTTQLYATSLNNLDTYLAMFHGIGFMSPGCQTEFKINKPEALVYTPPQLSAFTTKTSQLHTKLPVSKKRKR